MNPLSCCNLYRLIVLTTWLVSLSPGQVTTFPYTQNFDSLAPPTLPSGWGSSQNRTPGTNDFISSTGTAHSFPNAALSTNATISQTLLSPLFDFRNQVPDRLMFYTRRTATHLARVVVEASTDSGATFPLQLGDTLTNPGSTNYVTSSIQLPAVVANRNGVRFRWRIIADAGGNTGTFRIDDIAVTVLASHDLSLAGLRFSPQTPVEQDSIRAFAFVKNVGLQAATSFLVNFYNDLNNDSLPQPNELLAVASYSLPLAVSDSIEVSAPLGSFPPGQRVIIALAVYQADQNLQNNQMRLALQIGYLRYSIVVNEIMYAPTNAEPEWVELYNARPDSVDIKNWMISDNVVATRRVVATTSIFLAPRSFVVLTKDSAALIDAHPDIPSRIINIPSMPTLNNTGDAVVVYDNRNVTMDSLSYLPGWGGNAGGKSLERIDPVGSSTAQLNWTTSRHPNRSTPGRKNSITRKDYDIALDTLFLSPPLPLNEDSVVVSGRIRNPGFEPAKSFVVELYDDANGDSIPQPEELLSTIDHPGVLLPLDSVLVFFPSFHATRMEHPLIATVSMLADEDTLNNRCFISLIVGIPRASVVINEIMYSPTTEPEWIELYNTTAESTDVKGWKLSNRNTSSRYIITSTPITMPPYGYAVITKDTALLHQEHPHLDGLLVQVPTLPTFLFNNSGDAVLVYDGRNVTMDSMSYLSGWGGNSGGRSLERISPVGSSTSQSNWSTSRHPGRSTPDRRNSVTRKDYDLAADTLLMFPPFPIHGDSIVFEFKVTNIGFQNVPSYTLKLFDDINRDSLPQPNEVIYSVLRSFPLVPLDSFMFSFVPYNPARNDIIMIGTVDFAQDEDTTNNAALTHAQIGYRKGSLVISEIMYGPVDEPEWVELYNATAESIDVKQWKVSNRFTANRYVVASSTVFVPPRGYAVIVKDTALLAQRYGRLSGIVFQVPSLPTFLFNNSGDAVFVFDGRDFPMDSVRYAPAWGGNGGTSLERIDLLDEPGDSLNWSSSTDSMRATPVRENSVAALDHDLRAMKNVTLSSPPHVPATLSVTVKNIGRMATSEFDVAFFDDRNRDSLAAPDEFIGGVHVARSLARNETLRVTAQWPDSPPGIHSVIARVEYTTDLRLANNSTIFSVKIGYEPRSVVVNEIMFAPFTNDAEYVEIVNASTIPVDLTGWKLSDRPGTTGSANEFSLSTQGEVLQPGRLFVIASDSSIFSRFRNLDTVQSGLLSVARQSSLSLNNDGDAVIIRDATGGTIDSVAYVPAWHHPGVTDATGRSLEKISPALNSNDARSWSSCVLGVGGTPGLANSIFMSALPTHASISCSPNPFSPDGDGREDFSVIHCELPTDVAVVNMRIFDAKGRLIRHLANNEPTGALRDIVWDGLDNERQKARMGIYVVLVEGLNERGGNVYSAKGVVVLAARL